MDAAPERNDFIRTPRVEAGPTQQERGRFQVRLAAAMFPDLAPSDAVFEWTENADSPLSPSALFAEYEKRNRGMRYLDPTPEQIAEVLAGMEAIRLELLGENQAQAA